MVESLITYMVHTLTFSKLKLFISSVIALFTALIWGYTALIEALFMLMVIDFVLWFVNAWQKNALSRERMRNGFIKIIWYCIALIVLNYTSIAVFWANIGGYGVKEFWVSYLAVHEWISTLRHLACMWVPIPKSLLDKLENYKEKLDSIKS